MQLTLKLDENARRPVIKLNWFYGCRALLDTGALFPVWTGSDTILCKLDAELIKEEVVSFGGFGGKAFGKLYKVNFLFDKLMFIDMPIVVTQMQSLNCHIILPATMFDKMIYEIDTINHVLNIDTKDNQIVRILKVLEDGGKLSAYLAGTYESIDEYKNKEIISEEFTTIISKKPYIKSAYEQLQIISQDDKKRMEYEAREKAIRYYNYLISSAEKKDDWKDIKKEN